MQRLVFENQLMRVKEQMADFSILMAEDDANLSFVIRDNLELQGFQVFVAENGSEAWQIFIQNKIDICLLDVMMPEMDGFSLAQKIRQSNPEVPIIFLTAKTQKEDRLTGFRIGGDDYITKPFSIEELVFRIEVFLKRSGLKKPSEKASLFLYGNIEFNAAQLSLKTQEGNVSLTQKEAELLSYLFANKNKILKREEILIAIWGTDDYYKGRSLDVFISKIRKYLQSESGLEIQTIHGHGFKFIVQEKFT